MATSTQLTTHSRKGLTNRFNFKRKKPGRDTANIALTTKSYRLTTDPQKSSMVYDGAMWEFRSESSRAYSTLQNWCVKSAKRTSRADLLKFRPPNPFNLTLQEFWDTQENEAVLRSGSTLSVYSGGFPDLVNLNWNASRWINSTSGDIVSDFNATARAQTETLIKLKDMKVNFGEALAESRSTIQHLAKTTRTLLKAYTYAKRGKWTKLLKELKVNPKRKWSTKDPAGRWLEVQFGWTPLIGDIKGAFELNQTMLRKNGLFLSAERNLVSSYSNEDICSLPTERYRGSSCLFTGTRGTAVKLYARVRDEDIARLTSLGLSDPLQVAWALVPFSFVVDWVLPVGSYLEALGAVKGLTFVSGTRTEFINGSVDISAEYTTTTAKGIGTFKKKGQILAVRRHVYSGFPTPIPFVKSPFSTSHVISTLALIRTIAFKR